MALNLHLWSFARQSLVSCFSNSQPPNLQGCKAQEMPARLGLYVSLFYYGCAVRRSVLYTHTHTHTHTHTDTHTHTTLLWNHQEYLSYRYEVDGEICLWESIWLTLQEWLMYNGQGVLASVQLLWGTPTFWLSILGFLVTTLVWTLYNS
jgi:hypothetical protein